MSSLPAKQCALPTFLIASRKNRRNLLPSFLQNAQTSGAAGSGWRSWGTRDTSRTIRQLGSCSLKGISPNGAKSRATATDRAPTALAWLLCPSSSLRRRGFFPAPVHPRLEEACSPSLRAGQGAATAAPLRRAQPGPAADGAAASHGDFWAENPCP